MDPEKLLYLCTSAASSVINAMKKPPSRVKSILVVKLDEIGDMIYTLHCIEALAIRFPDAKIDVWCKSMNNGLVQQTGCVSTVVNDGHALASRYDVQVDFRGNWQSLNRALRGKCGYYLDRGSIRLSNKFSGGQKHEVVTNQETITSLFPKDFEWPKPSLRPAESDQSFVNSLLQKHGLTSYVVMHCGARNAARRWPIERFAALIDLIYKKYHLKTVLVGSANEHDSNQAVVAQCGHAINFAGETNLNQLTCLIRSCTFFVGNESGPLHFAIVEQKPLVALFGPGVKDVFYPLYDRQEVIHYFKENNHTSQTEENSTILQITVDEVVDKIESVYS